MELMYLHCASNLFLSISEKLRKTIQNIFQPKFTGHISPLPRKKRKREGEKRNGSAILMPSAGRVDS
jgi:hypothetical protein